MEVICPKRSEIMLNFIKSQYKIRLIKNLLAFRPCKMEEPQSTESKYHICYQDNGEIGALGC